MTFELFAQQKAKTLAIDTINLRGIVYHVNGKPAAGIILMSKQKDLKYYTYAISAKTDSNGYFELKGAKPNDTVSIRSLSYNGILSYTNNGSRYLVIYLPSERVIDLSNNPIPEVRAKRKIPKKIPKFKIIEDQRGIVYQSIENEPEFPGGIANFYTYLQKHLSYPEKAINNNIEGRVEISFDINIDGSLSGFKVIKGIGYGCDDVLLEILKKSPKWRPGIINGRHYVAHFALSIDFKLTDS